VSRESRCDARIRLRHSLVWKFVRLPHRRRPRESDRKKTTTSISKAFSTGKAFLLELEKNSQKSLEA